MPRHGVVAVAEGIPVMRPAYGAGFRCFASGGFPFVGEGPAGCFAAHGAGLWGGTGSARPLVAERVPVGIAAHGTGFCGGAGGLLPFVRMERAGTRTEQAAQDSDKKEQANVSLCFIRHGNTLFSTFLWSITMILLEYGNVK